MSQPPNNKTFFGLNPERKRDAWIIIILMVLIACISPSVSEGEDDKPVTKEVKAVSSVAPQRITVYV